MTANKTTNETPPTPSPNNDTIDDTPVVLDQNLESDSSTTEEEKSTSGAISAEIAPRTPNKGILENVIQIASPAQRVIASCIDIAKDATDGYDSDGALGPFFDANIMEGEQDFEEENVSSVPPSVATEPDTSVNADNEEHLPTPCHVPIEDAQLKKMKVAELREELLKRKQSTKGLKTELLTRLKKALHDNVHVFSIVINKENENAKKKKVPKRSPFDLAEGAWWKVLVSDSVVEEPSNPTFFEPRAPTEEAQHVPRKYNFKEEFERPSFDASMKKNICFANGTEKKNRDGTPMIEEVKRMNGSPDRTFIKKNNLSTLSLPSDFIAALFPYMDNIYSTNKKEYISIKQLTQV